MNNKILEVKDLKVSFSARGEVVQAVRGIDLEVNKGEILGIVGESGSGKSVGMKGILGILPENATIDAKEIKLNNKSLLNIDENEYRKLRGKNITMIFQDPMTALNPLITIGKQLNEVILRHSNLNKKEAKERAISILKKVGIPMAEKRLKQYPHEFSGGMRQRVLIAMALCLEPELLIADEPTTALDVTIQAQILDLLKDLQNELKTSIILITHDMGVVASICDKIAIMYGGLIMEKGTTEEIFYNPHHPYTKALLKAIPSLDLKRGQRLMSIEGTPPSLTNPPKGCPFYNRCNEAMDICREAMPQNVKFSSTSSCLCHLYKEQN